MARLFADRGFCAIGPTGPFAPTALAPIRFAEKFRSPTLVIHGEKDRLVSPSGGRATAKAIPGARLLTIEGMGHDLPRGAWPRIIDAIAENAARTREPAAA